MAKLEGSNEKTHLKHDNYFQYVVHYFIGIFVFMNVRSLDRSVVMNVNNVSNCVFL